MKQQQSDTIFLKDITSIHRWIRCLAVVSFDIDQGQKVDLLIPVQQLSPAAEKQIAMLAFPDSNALGDNQGVFKYIFRNSSGHFGYTCFKQKKDQLNPRGYSQKSLVVLSQLPFLVFFQKIAQFMVFKSFTGNSNVHQNLVTLCNQIAKWPDPQPLTSYILPVLDYQITIQIPNYALRYQNSPIPYRKKQGSQSQSQKQIVSLEQVLTKQSMLRSGLFQQVRLSQQYANCLQALWQVWYLTLTNKSYLLMSDNPYTVSQAVLGAISIISPFIYVGKFHPYVTVYDPHLNDLQINEKDHISGGTNPLFHKLFTKIDIINLNSSYKIKKNLIPVKELCGKCTTQQKKAINQAAIRKYFYRLNQNIIAIIDFYLQMQINDLKFFNKKEFFKYLKSRKHYEGLQDVFDGKKHLLSFFEELIDSGNFGLFIKKRNVLIKTDQK